MTCYLARSVARLLLFEPDLCDLGGELRVAAPAAVRPRVRSATVAAADLLRRVGKPGPAEALLHRPTYADRHGRPADHRPGARGPGPVS